MSKLADKESAQPGESMRLSKGWHLVPLILQTAAVLAFVAMAFGGLPQLSHRSKEQDRESKVAASELEPVQRFAQQISQREGRPYVVVTLPAGSISHQQGLRYAVFPAVDVPDLLGGGSTLVSESSTGIGPKASSAIGGGQP